MVMNSYSLSTSIRNYCNFVSRQEWQEVSREVSRFVPRFDQVDMVEGITTFIHMVNL